MYFSLPTILALLSAPILAFAQNPNPFKIPASGLSATGGQPLDLEWTPTTEGTVSLILRSGSSNNLDKGTVIASKIDNSGSYTWTPSNSLPSGTDYTIEIVDDANPDLTNYTPFFTLDTTTTGAPSSTPEVSSASATGSASTVVASTSSTITLPIVNTFTHNTTGGTSLTTISGSPSEAPTATSTSASTPAQAGAARATAMAAGMLGVALGALVL